jgi:hypothetical protein
MRRNLHPSKQMLGKHFLNRVHDIFLVYEYDTIQESKEKGEFIPIEGYKIRAVVLNMA